MVSSSQCRVTVTLLPVVTCSKGSPMVSSSSQCRVTVTLLPVVTCSKGSPMVVVASAGLQ